MEWLGDRAARREFERFVAEAAGRTACLMAGDSQDAEDLVQETYIRVARRWTRVRSMDHPLAYARRVLVTVALDGAARRTRERVELEAAAAGTDVADKSAAQVLQDIDDAAEFGWALRQLPPRQRAVLVLRYWEDLPMAEVAQILGCSAGTVKSAASRGAARLAVVLSDRAPALPVAARTSAPATGPTGRTATDPITSTPAEEAASHDHH
jgi:RNA polymerase sigma-70 factor (sigma-E family)